MVNNGLCVYRTLSLSSSHIPERSAMALGLCHTVNATRRQRSLDIDMVEACTKAELWCTLSYSPWSVYGWMIALSHEAAEDVRQMGHVELAAVLQFALDHGCDYLLLDCDGSPCDRLPTFEW